MTEVIPKPVVIALNGEIFALPSFLVADSLKVWAQNARNWQHLNYPEATARGTHPDSTA
jgi:hypothetical protein